MEPSAPDGQLIVPFDYVSGDPLSASSTYVGATIASLGMTPGEYVWTWGSGDTADSFTLNVGVCEQDLGICEGDLGICKGELTGAKEDVAVLLALTADEDGDGLFDQFDSCPGTPAGEAIDASGCSRAQFCETAGGGKPRLCHFADWQNDELGRPRDCKYSGGICQPR
jgi:hypothetical protein